MPLDNLFPLRPTDLDALTVHLQHSDEPIAALPQTLPEKLLVSVARDLRMLHEISDDDDRTSGFLRAPMMLLASLHLSVAKGADSVGISEGCFYKSMMVYQWATEREVIRRITRSSVGDDQEILLRKFESISTEFRQSCI